MVAETLGLITTVHIIPDSMMVLAMVSIPDSGLMEWEIWVFLLGIRFIVLRFILVGEDPVGILD